MVSTFGRAQGAALRKGFKDDIDTYLLISGNKNDRNRRRNTFWCFSLAGMWSTAFYFGNFLGPTVAGVTVDLYGFRATTVGFFVLMCLMLIVDFFELGYTIKTTKKTGYEQL